MLRNLRVILQDIDDAIQSLLSVIDMPVVNTDNNPDPVISDVNPDPLISGKTIAPCKCEQIDNEWRDVISDLNARVIALERNSVPRPVWSPINTVPWD